MKDQELEFLKNEVNIKQFLELIQKADDFAMKAQAENTRLAYRRDWEDFEFWCLQNNLASLPASPEVVALYLTDRTSNSWSRPIRGSIENFGPLKVSSILRRLAAITKAHSLANKPFNRRHPTLCQVLAGIIREKGKNEEIMRKKPLLTDDIRQIIQKTIMHESHQRPKDVRDKALLLLGFAGALRRSELVALDAGDLEFERDGIKLTIRHSKTDQESKGVVIAIPYGSKPHTCPVRSMQDWLSASGIQLGPLFRPINRHGKIGASRLTTRAVALIIQDRLKELHVLEGLEEDGAEQESKKYGGHSLRAGLITSAAANNVPEYLIMQQSRHKNSDVLRSYIRNVPSYDDNAVALIGL